MGAAALRHTLPAAVGSPIETPRLVMEMDINGREVRLTLRLRPALRSVGWIAVTRRAGAAEIRCWMQPEDRDRGLMSEAASHCGPAIECLGADVLRAEIRGDDPAAQAIARRLGLRPAGVARAGAIRVEKDLCGLL